MPRPRFIRYVNAGTLGEPGVLRALTDIQEVKPITLQHYGLRLQPLELIANQKVRDDLTAGWNDRGVPFYGATTLVRRHWESTKANYVEIPIAEWGEVEDRLKGWGYHSDRWFRFSKFLQYTTRGIQSLTFVTELLGPEALTVHMPENYQNSPEYKTFVAKMEEGIRDYRKRVEG